MKKITILAFFLALSGCETPRVSQEEAASVNYGPKPLHWQDTIRGYLSVRLVDPKTAIVEFRTEPKQLFQRQIALDPQQHGWAVCVWVNDKNRQGAYDGFRPMTFFIRNEKIVAANNDPDHNGPIFEEYARRQCAQLGAPFKG
jgi:hypothetical protein